jgi:hypothetical protein
MSYVSKIIFCLLLSSSVSLAKGFKAGDKADVEWKGKYFKGAISKTDACFLVSYDSDQSLGYHTRESLGAAGASAPGAFKGTAGQKVSAKWTDGQWYPATIKNADHCYFVSYVGWPDFAPEWVNQGRVFPLGSKVKGDTGAAATAAAQKASSPTSGFKAANPKDLKNCPAWGLKSNGTYDNGSCVSWTAEQIAWCRSLPQDKCNAAMQPQCFWSIGKMKCGVPGLD